MLHLINTKELMSLYSIPTQNTDQNTKFDVTSGEAAEKDDKVLETVSQ